MPKNKEKKEITRKNYVARFSVRGTISINDYTFSMDQHSEKSDWIYNRLNLGVNCGADNGTVYVSAMGGYGQNRQNVLYVHGKEDGKDDFSNQYTIAWEDRNDKGILDEIGDFCFKTVSIEKDTKGNLVQNRFLSEYDMIQYLKDNLADDMCLAISGDLEWQVYNGNISVQRNITNVVLVEDDPEKYHANFTQTVFIDKDSYSKDEYDKDKGIFYISGYVLEWFKQYNGYDLIDDAHPKGRFVPLLATFEYLPPKDKDKMVKAIKYLFKPKKGISQITFEGEFISSGAVVQATMDDVPDDIKELIDMGLITEDEALTKCADNGSRENRMVLIKPNIKKIRKDDDTIIPQIQVFPEEYDDEDFDLYFCHPAEEDEDGFTSADDDTIPFNEDSDDDDFMKFLDEL